MFFQIFISSVGSFQVTEPLSDWLNVGLLDHVTVLIGIALNGKAVAGVMHQPYYNYKSGPSASLGRTIWGVVGVGEFQAVGKLAKLQQIEFLCTKAELILLE